MKISGNICLHITYTSVWLNLHWPPQQPQGRGGWQSPCQCWSLPLWSWLWERPGCYEAVFWPSQASLEVQNLYFRSPRVTSIYRKELTVKTRKKRSAACKLTLIKMALRHPYVEWPKKRSVLTVPPLQLIQKFKVEDTNKISKSQQLIDSKEVFYTTFTFWFHLFRSADKIYEDETVVNLQRDRKDNFIPSPFYIDWFAAPPPPILRSYWLAQRPTTPILPSYWLAQRQTTSHVLGCRRERGGGWYYITTSRMAEGSKDPCISHVDATHGEWPRIESSLLFCIFFFVKIIEKSLFYEPEIGFIGKITY